MKFFPTTEAYVEPSAGSYKYVYQYKDHLGNVRLSYNKNLVIQEENNYYPFGLKQEGYNTVKNSTSEALKYKFLGQERQDELGLNWDTFRHRNYDYAIGRFFGVDPVSEEYMSISTYQFAHNNPVWKIEIEGLEGAPSNGKTDITNHEPIKVKNTPVLGLVGTVFKSEVVQQSAPKVVEKVAGGLSPLAKLTTNVVSIVTAVLHDYMSPNFGRTNERPLKFDIKVDEKLSIKDHKVEEKTIEETGIKRLENKIDDLVDPSTPGEKTKGRSTLFEREGGLDAANKELDSLNPTNVREIEGGRVGTLPGGRTVNVRSGSSDGRPTMEIQNGKNKTKFRYND
ncbi:RHS repeat domain-containing protein [Flavobacterium chilense]|uniref:RHS repeat-associated core domain-containing protein n=1 Tax=Flavobacterium chilense TaxID=946677 RepID=A0A1M7N2Q7_9FLAO|nr:RHS repeat-associated core domain-containing protein [Flavobacterium chilense]SHM97235.1 RHS repeat-associated core domain-containing protein [Flavobacterium chilense]